MRVYTKEFKEQVLELARSLGSVEKASKQVGVPSATVYGWKSKARSKTEETIQAGNTENEEVIRLRKENAELKKVNHILKAAAAFFSQDHLK